MTDSEWPEYKPWEMAIRESQSEPTPLKNLFKSLAKRFQILCGIVRWLKGQVGNIERADRERDDRIRNLERIVRDLAQAFARKGAGR